MDELSPPLNVTQLNQRVVQVAREWGIPTARARRMLCTLIVSQMLPESVAVKGGMGVKLRLGERGTRATADLDVTTGTRRAEFQRAFSAQLARGWGSVPPFRGDQRRGRHEAVRVAFTATLKSKPIHDPGLARAEYVMHPYRVSLAFLGTAWAGLDVEVSDPETGPGHIRRYA